MIRKALSAVYATALTSTYFMDESSAQAAQRHAICIMYPCNNSGVRGIASFSQQSIVEPVKIACVVKGLNPNSKHGIQIHEFGDLIEGYPSTGQNYNPLNKRHGGPFDEERRMGDLGNLISDPFGNSYMCFKDQKISLHGEFSILGRSVVVHQNEDDLGKKGDEQSLKNGNTGTGLACGIIGLSKQFKNIPPTEQ